MPRRVTVVEVGPRDGLQNERVAVPAAAKVRLIELLADAGLPAGVVNFLPGPGDRVGDLLVEHPRTRFVSFTGSREVGIGIYERAGRASPGRRAARRSP